MENCKKLQHLVLRDVAFDEGSLNQTRPLWKPRSVVTQDRPLEELPQTLPSKAVCMAFDGIAETGAVVLTAYPARTELPRETTSLYLKADGIRDSPPGSQNPRPAKPVMLVPPVYGIEVLRPACANASARASS